MLIACNFHYVRWSYDAPYPGIHGLLPEQFEAQLDALAKSGKFVGSDDILCALEGKKTLPHHAIVITFDDGLREQFEVAWPILKRKGIPAIFYVNTVNRGENRMSTVHMIHLLRAHIKPGLLWDRMVIEAKNQGIDLGSACVEDEAAKKQYPYDSLEASRLKFMLNRVLDFRSTARLIDGLYTNFRGDQEAEVDSLYMTVDQIRMMHQAGCIGSHGHEHVPMGQMSEHGFAKQLGTSLTYFEEWLDERVPSFSFPYGAKSACHSALQKLAPDYGIKYAFTMERGGNPDLIAPLYLARYACNDLPGGNHARFTCEDLFDKAPLAAWYRSQSKDNS